MDFKFSIIIPHKNIPDLLQRCLDSIPKRDDIQVIIVDDNSDPNLVDFEHFPGLGQTNVEVYFDKSNKGAGHARNIGLDYVKGRWLIFADADDFFSQDIHQTLNEQYDYSIDIIFFKHKNVLSDDFSIECDRCYYFNEIIDSDYPLQKKEEILRCRHNTPWGKIFNAEFVKNNNIRFEEIPYSNDIYFNITAGCIAKKVEIRPKVFYYLTNRKGSLTAGNNKTLQEILVRACAHIRMQTIIENSRYSIDEKPASWLLPLIFEKDKILFCKTIKYCRNQKLSVIPLIAPMINKKHLYYNLILVTCFFLSYLVTDENTF